VQPPEELIVGHPFWKGLSPRHLHLLQERAKSETFGAGQLIFEEGQEAGHFFLIQTGQVRLDVSVPGRGAVTIQTLSAGAALGWSWLFPPYRWHFSARANETTELIAFDAQFLRDTADTDHDFGYEVIRRVSSVLFQRLLETRLLLVDFYG
jgi:CRP-like cAMP-binding protein